MGIGTDDPQAKLHVKSSSGLDGLKVEGDTKIEGHLQVDSLAVDKLQGDLQVEGNTKIEGDLEINGAISIEPKPFRLRKYSGGDSVHQNTHFPSDRWIVIIAGFNPDIPPSEDKGRGQRVYTFIKDGTWWIRADSMGTKESGWEINVLAIRKEWVEVHSLI